MPRDKSKNNLSRRSRSRDYNRDNPPSRHHSPDYENRQQRKYRYGSPSPFLSGKSVKRARSPNRTDRSEWTTTVTRSKSPLAGNSPKLCQYSRSVSRTTINRQDNPSSSNDVKKKSTDKKLKKSDKQREASFMSKQHKDVESITSGEESPEQTKCKKKKKKKKKMKELDDEDDDPLENIRNIVKQIEAEKFKSKSKSRRKSENSKRQVSVDYDETDTTKDDVLYEPESTGYFKPKTAMRAPQSRNYIKCRICHSYYSELKEDRNNHIRLHSKQTFLVKVPSDTWYFDIEEVIAHFARMGFSKHDLREKMQEMSLFTYPESLVGYSCSNCKENEPTLNCSTEEEFKDHAQNCTKKYNIDSCRISWCRGCHLRFETWQDLQSHISCYRHSRCFPKMEVIERIYDRASSSEFQLQPLATIVKQGNDSPTLGRKAIKTELNVTRRDQTDAVHDPAPNFDTIPLTIPSWRSTPMLAPAAVSWTNTASFDAYSELTTGPNVDELKEILRLSSRNIWQENQPQMPAYLWNLKPTHDPTVPHPKLIPPHHLSLHSQSRDEDDIEILEEIIDEETCLLSRCQWNSNHIPSCKRLEISKRCGLGKCQPDDLHQHSEFHRNKFRQRDGSFNRLICSQLQFYVNYIVDQSSKDHHYFDHKVTEIPSTIVKQEPGEYQYYQNTVRDPRLTGVYPRPRKLIPPKMEKFDGNQSFILATWTSSEAEQIIKRRQRQRYSRHT